MYQAKIYKVSCGCGCGKIYIGSTKDTLRGRWGNHKRMAKAHKNNTRKLFVHMNEVGFDMFNVVEMERFECRDNDHQRQVEDSHIQQHDTVSKGLNGMRAFVVDAERRQRKQEYDRHDERRRKTVLCDCGKHVRRDWLTRHARSRQHQTWQDFYDCIYS